MFNKKDYCYKLIGTLFISVLFIVSALHFGEGSIKRAIIIFCITVINYIIIWSINPLSEQVNEWIGHILFLLSPILVFGLIERFNEVKIWDIEKYRFVLNIVIISLIILFFYVITNSIKWAFVVSLILFYFIAVINNFVLRFRGIPILANDISSFDTALSVAGNYSFDLNNITLSNTILVITFIIIMCKVNPKNKLKGKNRIVAMLIYSVLLAGFYKNIYVTSVISDKGILVSGWDPQSSYIANGSILSFMVSSQYTKISKPEGYSLEVLDKIIDANGLAEEDNLKYKKPNVIVIMDESFANLKVLGEFDTSEDFMPFIRQLSQSTVSGNLYMSVFGGNTPNSEFEFLTGNTTAFLPAFSVPYKMYLNNPLSSLTYTLKSQGYIGNKAIHPYGGSGWSRTSVYPLLGFEDFITIEDFVDPEYIRCFVSDDENFKKIIEEYEKAREVDDGAFYVFNVTMQNHGGYDQDFDNLDRTIKILGDAQNDQVERYLNLIKKTDEAFEELTNYFSEVEEDTVILLFGDHHPALPREFYQAIEFNTFDVESEEVLASYIVPFVIWANYDIGSQRYERLSANYLSSVLLEVMEAKKTGYNQFLLNISARIPVITSKGYYGEDGKFYQLADESPYEDILNEYNIVQYNNMFDIKNRRDDFFFLSGSK